MGITTSYIHRWHDGEQVLLPSRSNELAVGKVVCVGRNYADHIKEMNSATPSEVVLFLKPSTALCDATQPIKISHLSHLGDMHHELEIALLIGQQQRILGIGLGIDLTLRDVQTQLKQKGLPWERAKAFDGSCAVSPFIPFSSNDIDLSNITLELELNGKTQQHGNSALMLHPIKQLLHDISSVFTLQAGDIVLTGTPAGVGPLSAGDQLSGYLNKQALFSKTTVI